MFKLCVFAALVAVASAGLIGAPVVSTYGHAVAAPLAYSAAVHHPIAYSAAIPAPVTYASGYKVAYSVEPVEQHGYKIAY